PRQQTIGEWSDKTVKPLLRNRHPPASHSKIFALTSHCRPSRPLKSLDFAAVQHPGSAAFLPTLPVNNAGGIYLKVGMGIFAFFQTSTCRAQRALQRPYPCQGLATDNTFCLLILGYSTPAKPRLRLTRWSSSSARRRFRAFSRSAADWLCRLRM